MVIQPNIDYNPRKKKMYEIITMYLLYIYYRCLLLIHAYVIQSASVWIYISCCQRCRNVNSVHRGFGSFHRQCGLKPFTSSVVIMGHGYTRVDGFVIRICLFEKKFYQCLILNVSLYIILTKNELHECFHIAVRRTVYVVQQYENTHVHCM